MTKIFSIMTKFETIKTNGEHAVKLLEPWLRSLPVVCCPGPVQQCGAAPLFSHKMTRCQPPSHLALLAKTPLMSFFPPSLAGFCSPVIPKVTFPPPKPLQHFPALFSWWGGVVAALGADKRWERGRLTGSREGETREEVMVWKREETGRLTSRKRRSQPGRAMASEDGDACTAASNRTGD